MSTISPQVCTKLREKDIAPERIVEFRNWDNGVKGFCAPIERLLDDPELCGGLSRQARERALTRWSKYEVLRMLWEKLVEPLV